MASGEQTSSAEPYTYHCLCTQLVLATSVPLTQHQRRQIDNTSIAEAISPQDALKQQEAGIEVARRVVFKDPVNDSQPVIVQSENGYEKRYEIKCPRCSLVIGYRLDERKAGHMDVVYILAGGLQSTQEMDGGQSMDDRSKQLGLVN